MKVKKVRTSTGKVLKLVPPRKCKETIEILSRALKDAKAGNIQGIGLITVQNERIFSTEWTGAMRWHYTDLLCACRVMEKRLIEEGLRDEG